MGKRNKVVKLTDKDVRCIIRIKRNASKMRVAYLGDETNEKNDFSDETLFGNNGTGSIDPCHKHSRYG
jgi:hypothetical protein